MYKNIYHGVYIPTPNESDFKSAVAVLEKFGLKIRGVPSRYIGVNLAESLFANFIYSFYGNIGNQQYLIQDFLPEYMPQLEIGQYYTLNQVPYVPVINDEIVSSEKGNFKLNINTEVAPLIRYQIDKELGPVYVFGLKGSPDKAYIAVEFKDIHTLISEQHQLAEKPVKAPILKGCFVVVTERFSVIQKDNNKLIVFTPGDILLIEDVPKEGIYQVFGNFLINDYLVRLAKVEEVTEKKDSLGFGGIKVEFNGSGASVMSAKFGADELKAIRILLNQGVELTLAGTTIGLNEYYYLHLFSGIPYNI